MNENREHGLIFFDGICNLCNHTVQFIIKRDQQDYFRFAALQSDVAKDQLTLLNDGKDKIAAHESNQQTLKSPANQEKVVVSNQQALNTIVLLEGGKAYYRSTAALRITKRLGGLWPMLYALIIIPSFIRDFCYQLISKNRYRIWGRQESCMIPSPELKSKFL
ncbi:DCC1-like thiol-disulfide oxidoreductase family protein [Pedobacter sp. PLR]|uniref:thiol-disulfide oxidoreductase DCC family protein n=1 Tax=Pedobacter sp. PLR TaxID=2994465 RepID=UPI00224875D0|nr:DCC1-like thiol-disulfide oxidoreductase family protein [Pedobacter sp. PLR]MCX2451725.1 DCC1-like thiol-disulfide oxidoreductase family protein [Pedobacter sp. PLR]